MRQENNDSKGKPSRNQENEQKQSLCQRKATNRGERHGIKGFSHRAIAQKKDKQSPRGSEREEPKSNEKRHGKKDSMKKKKETENLEAVVETSVHQVRNVRGLAESFLSQSGPRQSDDRIDAFTIRLTIFDHLISRMDMMC
jgi:hypothetical protein